MPGSRAGLGNDATNGKPRYFPMEAGADFAEGHSGDIARAWKTHPECTRQRETANMSHHGSLSTERGDFGGKY